MTRMLMATGLVLAAVVGCRGGASTRPGVDFIALLGEENLEGWTIENGGDFSVQDGRLVVNRGTGWLRSNREYGDFVLQVHFRFLEPDANSGIFVRTGSTSHDDENGWPNDGYQVQCRDTTTGESPLGAMIPYGAPPFVHKSDQDAIERAYRPTGEWNQLKIRCEGEQLTVELNGELVTAAHDIKNERGHIGIQAEHGHLEFKAIWIREL